VNHIAEQDAILWRAMQAEQKRQEQHIELIASENYAGAAVMAAQGSMLTNKYAEGYPHKRYYGGCEFVDEVESLAIERAKQLFGAAYANVQPHSGSQANAAVYLALLEPGDVIVGMGLDQGGHLTHGASVNFSGRLYRSYTYGLNASGDDIDYQQMAELVSAHRPKLLIGGFSAFSGVVDWQRMRDIADTVGAYLLVDMAHIAGLVAAGLYPSPVNIADVCTSTTHKTLRGPRGGIILAKDNPALHKKLNSAVFPGMQGGPLMHVIAAKAVAFQEAIQDDFKLYQQQVLKNAQAMADAFTKADIAVVSGGTHNHLFMLDLVALGITGKQAEERLGEAFITLNKNTIPNDPQSPFVTSGLRIGTPAITTRGFKEVECVAVANWMAAILKDLENDQLIADVRQKVCALTERFPVYQSTNMEA
jgi:glycine hydroxymethyltransferase